MVNQKLDRIPPVQKPPAGSEADTHYLAFFECFSRQQYFEAHEVLEVLWLKERTGPNGSYYQGLIQLAGAFVHLQKQQLPPAAGLLRTARNRLQGYPAFYLRLDVSRVLELIGHWLRTLEGGRFAPGLLSTDQAPQLTLEPAIR
jgi:predicted metal-dependent hydrolase